MTQSIPAVGIEDLHDPNDIIQGSTRETRIYYRTGTKVSFIEKSTGKELKPLTPEIMKEIRRRISLGEVEEKTEQVWMPTTPLPSDAWHMNYYVKKGFKLWPPGQEPNQETQDALQARIKKLEAELIEEKADRERAGVVDSPVRVSKVEVNPLACQIKGCSSFGKPFPTFLGLARHMRSKHDQK